MEGNKENLIELINQIKEETDIIRKKCLEDQSILDKVKVLSTQLKEIENVLNPKKNKFKENINRLDEILFELSNIKFEKISEKIEEMFENIDKNLLDGMSLSNIEDTHDQLIIFENREVGKIEVLDEYKPQVKIAVTIYDKSEEFEINDHIRIYNIISFINTNFNYKY